MIKTFTDKATAALFAGKRVKAWGPELTRQAQRKLAMLNRAASLDDLKVPPGNRLEQLVGDREGQHSIRINDQWRVCLEWGDGHAWGSRSLTITEGQAAMSIAVESLPSCDFSDVAEGDLSPVPPGEILAHEFLEPLAITPYRLAKSIGVPQ